MTDEQILKSSPNLSILVLGRDDEDTNETFLPIGEYSKRLGIIAPEQFQAALDRFGLGKFLRAEPIPYGFSKSNVFLTSTSGEYVFRGSPFPTDQFPSERFYAQQLHDRTEVPVPWPFLIDPNDDIFGWSYAIMPRMPGLQLADDNARKKSLPKEERHAVARAMGKNLALMQEVRWAFSGQWACA